MKKRVLVTGANGQLGKTFQELYSENIDNIDFTFVNKSELDITSITQLRELFQNKKFNYCINCAAYTNVEQAEKTPEIAFKINAEAVKNLAEICKVFNVTLIHISTDYVFDGEAKEPYTENSKTNPINKYGESKLLGELYIQQFLEKFFIIRTSWLYSKKYGHNFYKTILSKAKDGQQLTITDEQLGCPTDTVDLTHYVYNLIIQGLSSYGVKHYCGGNQLTWYDFAVKILKDNNLFVTSNIVKASKYITFAKRPKYSVLRNNK